MVKNRQRVSRRTHPHLGWGGRERGTYIVEELIQSDAFRTLTKTETDILLFVWQRRQYRKRRKKDDPLNNTSLMARGFLEPVSLGGVRHRVARYLLLPARQTTLFNLLTGLEEEQDHA